MADTIYSDPVAALRTDTGTRPREASASALLALYRSDIPSAPVHDVWTQTNRYEGVVYLCISKMRDAFQAATVQLLRPRKQTDRILKAMPTAFGQSSDEKWVPVVNHEFARILERPNPQDTFPDLIGQIIIQYRLTGQALVWGPRNTAGKPRELYVLPTALCWPVAASAQYPVGGWRVNAAYMNGASGILPGGLAGAGGAILDRREVYSLRNPHPLYRWAPYSDQAGAKYQCDLIEKVDRAAWSTMERSVRPSGVLCVPGADQEQLNRVAAEIIKRHAGADNQGGIFGIGGAVDGKAGTFIPWQAPAPEMYEAAWDRYSNFVIAVFGLHKALTGLTNTSSFAELYAAIKYTYTNSFQPFCQRLGAFLTQGPCEDWDRRLKVQVDLPKVDDPDLIERQISTDGSMSTITVNEIRALRGRPPLEGGDVPPKVYEQIALQKAQPQQPPAAAGAPQPDAPDAGEEQPEGDGQQSWQDESQAAPQVASPSDGPPAQPQAAAPEPDAGDDDDADIKNDVARHALAMMGVPHSGNAQEPANDDAQTLTMAALMAKADGDDETAKAIAALAHHPEAAGDLMSELGQPVMKAATPVVTHQSAWAQKHGLVFDSASHRWKKPGTATAQADDRKSRDPAYEDKAKYYTPDAVDATPGSRSIAHASIAEVVQLAKESPDQLTHEHVKIIAENIGAIKADEAKNLLREMGVKAGAFAQERAVQLYSHVRGLVHGDKMEPLDTDAKMHEWFGEIDNRTRINRNNTIPGGKPTATTATPQQQPVATPTTPQKPKPTKQRDPDEHLDDGPPANTAAATPVPAQQSPAPKPQQYDDDDYVQPLNDDKADAQPADTTPSPTQTPKDEATPPDDEPHSIKTPAQQASHPLFGKLKDVLTDKDGKYAPEFRSAVSTITNGGKNAGGLFITKRMLDVISKSTGKVYDSSLIGAKLMIEPSGKGGVNFTHLIPASQPSPERAAAMAKRPSSITDPSSDANTSSQSHLDEPPLEDVSPDDVAAFSNRPDAASLPPKKPAYEVVDDAEQEWDDAKGTGTPTPTPTPTPSPVPTKPGQWSDAERESVVRQLAAHKVASKELGKLGLTVEKLKLMGHAGLKQFADEYGISPEPQPGGSPTPTPIGSSGSGGGSNRQKKDPHLSPLTKAEQWAPDQANQHVDALMSHLRGRGVTMNRDRARTILHDAIKHAAWRAHINADRGGDPVEHVRTVVKPTPDHPQGLEIAVKMGDDGTPTMVMRPTQAEPDARSIGEKAAANPKKLSAIKQAKEWVADYAEKHADAVVEHFRSQGRAITREQAKSQLVDLMHKSAHQAFLHAERGGDAQVKLDSELQRLANTPAKSPRRTSGMPTGVPQPSNPTSAGSGVPRRGFLSRLLGRKAFDGSILKGEPHDYSSTHVLATGPALKRALDAQSDIDPDDVLEYEDELHVTCKYGLLTSQPEDVRPYCTWSGPVKYTLGEVRAFEASETGQPHDVLYVEVRSPGLRKLNRRLCRLPHADTHPHYVPHMTLAYLKPGTAEKYVGMPVEVTGVATELVFSDQNGKITMIPLKDAPVAKSFSMNTMTGSEGGYLAAPVSNERRKQRKRKLTRKRKLGCVAKAFLDELEAEAENE